MRSFAGIDHRREAAPDETTVFKFRHLLQRHRLSRQLLATTNEHLERIGVQISNGTIVDAIIISAPALTTHRDDEGDSQTRQTAKRRR
jgi:IS5 family transposase